MRLVTVPGGSCEAPEYASGVRPLGSSNMGLSRVMATLGSCDIRPMQMDQTVSTVKQPQKVTLRTSISEGVRPMAGAAEFFRCRPISMAMRIHLPM